MKALIDVSTTPGNSYVAEILQKEFSRQNEHMQCSTSLGLEGKGVFNKLREVLVECSNPGWAGFNSLPIPITAYFYANSFLHSLPLGIPAPEPSAEPDGSLTLEWYKTPRKVFSISIGSDGIIHYALLSGQRKKYGSEPWDNNSKEIISMIYNIYD